MAGNNLGTAQGDIQVNTSGLKNADIALRSAGTSMVNFGQQAIGAFATVVKAAADFEKEMDFVQAVTNASGDEMKALEDKAIDLGKNSIFGPIELSQAFVELAKAGASVKDIIDGVGEASVKLATAADVEIPFAGENLINIMNTFKIGAEDAAHVADLLAGAANASSVELQDLVVSFKYAGPVAQGLGISIEDLNDALTILGKVGIKGSTAGTSLRAIMLNLSPATDKAKERFRELGIITEDGSNRFFDAAGNALDLASVFQILGDATKDLNNEQKVAALRDIFGVRAIPAALELLSQGEAGFAAINDEINRTTAADVAAKRMDNLDGSIKRLKATLQAMFVEAGGPFQSMLKGWVDGLRNVLLFIDGLPGPFKTAIVAAVGIIGVLSLLSGVFLLTIGNIVRMVRVMGEIKNAFSLFAGAARTATAANSALGASFLLNPVFLITAAIVALIAALVLLYFKFKPFRDFIDGLWQDIQRFWDQVLGVFRDAGDAILGFFDKVGSVFGSFTSTLSDVFSSAVDQLKSIGGAITKFPGQIKDVIVGALSAIPAALGKLPGMVANVIGQLASTILNFVKDLPAKIAYVVGYIIGRWFRLQFETIKLFVRMWKKIITTAIEWGKDFALAAGRAAADFLQAIVSFFVKLPGRVGEILSQMLQKALDIIPQMLQAGYDLASSFINGAFDLLVSLPGRYFNLIFEIYSTILSFIPKFASSAFELGQGVFNGIIDFFVKLPGRIAELLLDAVKAVINSVKSFFNAAKDIGNGLWEGFKDGLGIHSPSYIEKAIWGIEDSIKASAARMKGDLDLVNNLAGVVRPLSTSLATVGLQPAAQKAFAGAAGTGAGSTTNNYNAPLVGQASIRSVDDISKLARQLDTLKSNQMAARGIRSSSRLASR